MDDIVRHTFLECELFDRYCFSPSCIYDFVYHRNALVIIEGALGAILVDWSLQTNHGKPELSGNLLEEDKGWIAF